MIIEVFKAGTWTDSSGNTKTWTEEDLQKIVEMYNSQKEHEAPVVIGHPKDNAPAYGWVERLERKGSSIFAKIKPTVSEFLDWIKQGLYKKVSISLYPNMLLRHIGFLGAVPPAVKGLQAPEFSDSEYIEISFREWTKREREMLAKGEIKGGFAGPDNTFPIAGPEDVADAWRLAGHSDNPEEIRKNIIKIAKKYGWLSSLPKSAHEWAKEHNIEFLEGGKMMEEKVKVLEEQLKDKDKLLIELAEKNKQQEQEIRRLKEAIIQIEAEKRKREFNAFCEDLISKGKLLPKLKEKAVEFMEILTNLGEYEFSEGKKPAVNAFQEFLQSLPKIVEFGERATKDSSSKQVITRQEFEAMTAEQKYNFIKSNGKII